MLFSQARESFYEHQVAMQIVLFYNETLHSCVMDHSMQEDHN